MIYLYKLCFLPLLYVAKIDEVNATALLLFSHEKLKKPLKMVFLFFLYDQQ